MARRVRIAAAGERIQRQRDEPDGLLRGLLVVALDGDDPVRREVGEIVLVGLHRVERVLGEREGPGGGGRVRVDISGLDDVVFLMGPADVAPRLVGHHPHIGTIVDAAREGGVAAAHEVDDDRVHLHRRDPPRPLGDGCEKIDPAA